MKIKTYDEGKLVLGDCLKWMKNQPDDCVDLIIGSPPYESARTYGIDFKLKGQDWVDWMMDRMEQMVRISKGLVCMVVEGMTRDYQWSATPALLMADLHRKEIVLRHPCIFYRYGIPGSGGPDYLRNNFEFVVVCTKKAGKLPWSDNTACGTPPKYGPGGAMSHRTKSGERVRKKNRDITKQERQEIKRLVESEGISQRAACRKLGIDLQVSTSGVNDNGSMVAGTYVPPELANPGNVIDCGAVGGGHMGSNIAEENEAPFPSKLADLFVRSFCPKGGVVLDPFVGSGTTIASALNYKRKFIGIDIRENQIELCQRRIQQSYANQGFGF